MDYSLLVGIHFRDVSEDGDILPMTGGCRTPGGNFHVLLPSTTLQTLFHNHIMLNNRICLHFYF